MKKYYCLFLLFFYTSFSYSQEVGLPLTHHYSSKEYKAGVQVFSAIQDDSSELMYFGVTNVGIVEYDGSSWTHIPIPSKTAPYALVKGVHEHIYVGAIGEFGYLDRDSTGRMKYNSLIHLLDTTITVGVVWAAYTTTEDIYFHTSKYLFIYTPKTNKVKVVAPPKKGYFFNGFVYKDTYYMQMRGGEKPISKIVDGKITDVPKSEVIGKKDFYHLTNYSEDTLFVPFTAGGTYLYIPEKDLIEFKLEDNSFLENNVLDAVKNTGKYIAIGSRIKGAMLIDKSGKKKQIYNKKVEVNETINQILEDKSQNLWMITMDGVTKTGHSQDLSYWGKESGVLGSGHRVIRHNGTIYFTSTRSPFYIDKNGNAVAIEGFEQQTWELKEVNIDGKKHLIFGSHDGFYEIKEDKSTEYIASNGAAMSLLQSEKNSNRFFMTKNVDSLLVIDYEDGKWVNKGKIHGVSDNIRGMVEDGEYLWLETYTNGLICVHLNWDNITEPFEVKSYFPKKEMPAEHATAFKYEGKLLWASDKGFLEFDYETKKFVPFCDFGEQFCDGSIKSRYVQVKNGRIYIAYAENEKTDIGYLQKGADGKMEWIYKCFRRLPTLTEIEHIYIEDDNTLWITSEMGLIRYGEKYDTRSYDMPFTCLIRKVSFANDSITYYGQGDIEQFARSKYEYHERNVKFEFAAPFFDKEEQTEYSYMLEGYDKNWSNWSTEKRKEYTNLREYTYTFRVKARNIYDVESKEATFTFSVLPPWYRTWWAYSLYAILLIMLIWGIIRFNTKRLKKDKEILEKTVKERTTEIQQQKEELEQQTNNLIQANAEINQQKEEIEAQAENLKNANLSITEQKEEVEKSYKSIQTLSEIGQKITQVLNQKDLARTVYKNVTFLMPAEFFGIGLYNSKTKRLEFEGFIEFGKELPFHFDKLEEADKMSIRCLTSKTEIIENDFLKYLNEHSKEATIDIGHTPKSFIYLPLMVEDKMVGVITVQSTSVNAYDEQKVTMLRTLASYTSIALDNVAAYQTIEDKNKNITDSIRYAETIQGAILPHQVDLNRAFEEIFVLFRPKDIVSGDFYWFAQRGNKKYLAVVDCTGHGVPGAFMSMIGHSIFSEIINEFSFANAAELLEEANKRLVNALDQERDSNSDGMDACLIIVEDNLDTNEFKVNFAGAKRSLYYMLPHQKEILVIKPTKKSIGGKQRRIRNFENIELQVSKGTAFYLTTDGFVDQNNSVNVKFGSRKLLELFSHISQQQMEEQGQIIAKELDDFIEQTEQRDDITIIGIRV